MRNAVDVHIHHYPEAARLAPAKWARLKGEEIWKTLVTEGPQGWSDEAEILSALDDAGLEFGILQGWYWEHNETCAEQNAFLTDCAKKSGGRLRAMASINPAAGADECIHILEQAWKDGAVGLGEIHCGAQKFSLLSDDWMEICDWAHRYGWPILLHVTEPVGTSYAGRFETPLDEMVEMIKRCPSNRFILAHWGGGLVFFMRNPRVRQVFENVWFDSAASPLIYDRNIWRSAVDLTGIDRILFGSDFPLKLFPRRRSQPSILSLRQQLSECQLGEAVENAILADNARALFKISDRAE